MTAPHLGAGREPIATVPLSGAEMLALITVGRVMLAEAPTGDPLRLVLASAVRKLTDSVGITDA